MYRSESTSSSYSSVNGKSRGELKQVLKENGAALRRHVRTKDGKVTKATEKVSSLSPEALYFFRDELEKQAIFTPTSALKAMNSKNPVVRKAGHLGGSLQNVVARGTPGMINTVSNYPDPSFMVGAVKGEVARGALKEAVPVVRQKAKELGKTKTGERPAKFLNRLSEWGTFIERETPEIPGLSDAIQQGVSALVGG